MKEELMTIEWRTVQFFVSLDGVAEVEVDAESYKKIRCTCKSYATGKRCKHVRYIKARVEELGGQYNVRIPEDVPDEEAMEAILDKDTWRDFVIKYGEPEVL